MALDLWATRMGPESLDKPRDRYMRVFSKAMAEIAPRIEHFVPEVTYYTYYGDFDGGPRMELWFGFPTRAERKRAEAAGITNQIRTIATSIVVAGGYPEDAVPDKLLIAFTSEEEIQAGGGEFAYFRCPDMDALN